MKNNTEEKQVKIIIVLFVFLTVIISMNLVHTHGKVKQIVSQQEALVKEENENPYVVISLPEIVYVSSGLTMEIYNSQVTNLAEKITKYNVRWNCKVGENLERKFSVTANETNIGSYDLTLELYDNDLELIAQEKCVLKIIGENMQAKKTAQEITNISDVPSECLEQVKIGVDTKYNGTLEELKPEGLAQLQDVVYSVLCGNE